MTITGVKKAVAEYKRYNHRERLSGEYGALMLDRSSGEVWTDWFYSRNEWKVYHSASIINLVGWAMEHRAYPEITVANVKEWAEAACAEYAAEEAL